ncbi:BOI-related E3 ubiquitin-protein ligase 1-like [Cornus florida]|uniref:BOI-related E3 ubiquitin-protein ligase 1-like n=1 Tax=Cornus florida TaxID=4283 RepID=UPI0028A02BC2|nr:BOI-related E3 ubiquitin-protein ligase 1-like [Cornus florida]
MAVQAQYPSNVLFQNRSLEEGKNLLGNDYSLQPQPGGGFLDQSHIVFNNGGTNTSRKRGREFTGTTTQSINTFSLQTQPLQLIDLTQLHTQQRNVVSTGLQLAFEEQQQHHQHRPQTLSPQSSSSVLLSLLSEDLSPEIRRQSDEIEQFLRTQGEEMRRSLAEKRQRHYRALLGSAEESAARRLREKEVEVEKAARRNAELEARAAQLSAEAQVWQAKARAQEAAAASLQARLQHAIMSGRCAQEEGGGGVEGQADDAESAYIDPDRVVMTSGPSCKACRKRVASVVLLPCRHLCLCTECDASAQVCPLCLAFRNSSVEVFLS